MRNVLIPNGVFVKVPPPRWFFQRARTRVKLKALAFALVQESAKRASRAQVERWARNEEKNSERQKERLAGHGDAVRRE